ncbi:MAG: TIGR01212 family radical SAM protein [Clostridia bacterium]|nr:TIGR01212 family radical SAM protein [Clostridia bacterium]
MIVNSFKYNRVTEYYKKKFGERVLKICVDGSFTCPNRDGLKGTGGCIYCSNLGSGELIKKAPTITDQVKNYLSSYKSDRANKFIVYFQNYTNTYDTLENLKSKYDSSLIDDRIVGLSIATRPDMINEEVAKLLSTYKEKYYVQVELGFQTSNDRTKDFLNLKYNNSDLEKSLSILNNYEIDTVLHIMCGLPYESFEDIKNTVEYLNKLQYTGLKIHSTYVVKDTVLEKMYNDGSYIPITEEDYIKDLEYIITHVPENIIIHRIVGDAPKDILVAPEWNLHKKRILNTFNKIMKEKNLYQGIYYKGGQNG